MAELYSDNLAGMERNFLSFANRADGGAAPAAAAPSYADAAANGRAGGRRPPRQPPVAAPTPTHVTRVRTVLIDVKAVKPHHDRAERAALIIEDMELPAAAVTAIYMLQVEQLLLVTFDTEEVYNHAVDLLRAGVAWTAAGGRKVYGWPTTDSLLQVRLTNIHPDVTLDLLTALMARYGRVVLANRVAGRDPHFPNSSDGIVYMKMAVDEGSSFPDYIAVETNDGVLDSIIRVFTDNSLKRCHRCGQLGHLGAFCRRTAKSIADQGDVWARLRLPPPPPPLSLPPPANLAIAIAIAGPSASQPADSAVSRPVDSALSSFMPGVSPFSTLQSEASSGPSASQPADSALSQPVNSALSRPVDSALSSFMPGVSPFSTLQSEASSPGLGLHLSESEGQSTLDSLSARPQRQSAAAAAASQFRDDNFSDSSVRSRSPATSSASRKSGATSKSKGRGKNTPPAAAADKKRRTSSSPLGRRGRPPLITPPSENIEDGSESME